MASRVAVHVGDQGGDEYTVKAHLGRKLFIRYTDNPAKLANYINDLERFSAQDRYRVIGLDVEFTKPRARNGKHVAVLQLCVRDNVLLYHHCRASGTCDKLQQFLGNEQYTFATVDTTNDKKVLVNTGLKVANLVDIQKQYRVAGSGKSPKQKDSLEGLAKSIICPSYEGLKKTMTLKKKAWLHSTWEEKLTLEHIAYAAIDAFVGYDMYRRISTMRECLQQYTREEDAAQSSRRTRRAAKSGRKNW